jgi:hypothetical protein
MVQWPAAVSNVGGQLGSFPLSFTAPSVGASGLASAWGPPELDDASFAAASFGLPGPLPDEDDDEPDDVELDAPASVVPPRRPLSIPVLPPHATNATASPTQTRA